MNNLEIFLSSNRGKKLLNFFYSWGAAVVIIGATIKIIHLPYANIILMIGMFTEALVFLISGFDNSSQDSEASTASSGVVLANTNIDEKSLKSMPDSKTSNGFKDSGSVVIVNGGANNKNSESSNILDASRSSSDNVKTKSSKAQQSVTSEVAGSVNSDTSNSYNFNVNDAAQNLEEFSQTIKSLNEASQKLLGAYNQITAENGFVNNVSTLNQNVSGLNDVFSAQLQTITEQMSAIRYINDSLSRMKNLYDGAIGDSYMFREESAKMTKHIEALNNVYARLLQAMTNNNNPNTPNY